MSTWRAMVMRIVASAAPNFDEHGVPWCADLCPHHDGKRCALTGFRPSPVCEPVVAQMAKLLKEQSK